MDTSTVPGAGRGLFSLVARSVGEHLVDYTGEIISAAECEKRYPKDTVGVYCFQVSSSLFIDSALCRGVGASANASRRGIRPNARFVPNARSGSARIEITRRVRAGDEIFVSYGSEYWKGSYSSTHSTDGVPDWEWDLTDPFTSVSRSLSGFTGPGRPATGPWSVRTIDQAVLRFRSRSLINQLNNFLKDSSSAVQSIQSQTPIFPSEPRRFFPRSVWSIDFWRYAYDDVRAVP